MEIRQLKPNEFYALRDLLDQVFTRSNGRETVFSTLFPRIFAEPNEYCTSSHIGAFDGDRLIGTAAMYPIDYVVGGVHIRLIGNGNIVVHEDYRGRGVMMALLQRINEECDIIGEAGYEFAPMLPEEVARHMESASKRSDYVVRSEKDFIPALRSQGREPLTVFKNGSIVGYISFARKTGFVEEFAVDNGDEPGVFRALANEAASPINVRLSGYDVKTLTRLNAYVKDIKQSEPALFRIINAEPLKAGARSLGIDESIIYAPYLT